MKTLFEEVQEQLKLETGESGFFYRRALRNVAVKYASDPKRLILDEQKDSVDKDHQDQNVIRTLPKPGHLLFFEYEPKGNNTKFVDKFPVAYVIGLEENHFIAANLHFIEPNKRKVVLEQLQKNKMMIPRGCIGRYNIKQVKGLYLDIAKQEWTTASFIPIENFVKIQKGREISVKTVDVWKETDKTFNKILGGSGIEKTYSV